VERVSRFGSRNRQLRFGDLDLKITVIISLFGPQKQAGFGLSVAPQNRWREDGTGYASRSGGLLCLEASRARVFSLTSRLAEARRRVVHVTLSQRLRQDQVENGWVNATGYVRPCYPYFAVLYILDPRGISVF
jgi:hypothetical protein